MKQIIALIFFIAFSQATFKELLTLDCSGHVHMVHDHGLLSTTINLHESLKATSWFEAKARSHYDCICPTLSDANYDRYFNLASPAWYISRIGDRSDREPVLADCDLNMFPNLPKPDLETAEIILPSTCTLGNWESKKECGMSWAFPELHVTVYLAIKECSNNHPFPYISLVCEGDGCDNLFKPCNNDADCGDLTCYAPLVDKYDEYGNFTGQNHIPTAEDVYNLLRSLLIYGNEDVSPGCESSSNIVTHVLNWYRKFYDTGTQTTRSYVQICAPEAVLNQYGYVDVVEITNVVNCDVQFVPDCQTYYNQCWNDTTFEYYDCPYEQCYNVTDSIDCVTHGALSSFNGQTPGGTNLYASARVDGSAFNQISPTLDVSGSDVTIAYKSCKDTYYILPETPLALVAKLFSASEAVAEFRHIIDTVYDCRADLHNLANAEETYEARYNFLTLFYGLTSPAPSLGIESDAFSDWSDGFNVTQKLEMPSTCSYDSWKNDGVCALQYSGFQDLLSIDLTLQLKISKCSESDLPEIYFGCKGEDCHFFRGPTACNSDSDCPTSNTQCYVPEEWSEIIEDSSAPTQEPMETEYPEATYLHPVEPQSGTTYILLAPFITNYIFLFDVDSECMDENTIEEDIFDWIYSLSGKTREPNTPVKICLPDPDHIAATAPTWAQEQTTEGETLIVKGLDEWTGDLIIDPTGNGGDGDDDADSSSQLVVALFLASTFALMF